MSKTIISAHPGIPPFLMIDGIAVIPVRGVLSIRFRQERGGSPRRLGVIHGDGMPMVF